MPAQRPRGSGPKEEAERPSQSRSVRFRRLGEGDRSRWMVPGRPREPSELRAPDEVGQGPTRQEVDRHQKGDGLFSLHFFSGRIDPERALEAVEPVTTTNPVDRGKGL